MTTEYRKYTNELREYQNSEFFRSLKRTIETRLGDILMEIIKCANSEDLLRLQGRSQELKKILDDLNPIKVRAD